MIKIVILSGKNGPTKNFISSIFAEIGNVEKNKRVEQMSLMRPVNFIFLDIFKLMYFYTEAFSEYTDSIINIKFLSKMISKNSKVTYVNFTNSKFYAIQAIMKIVFLFLSPLLVSYSIYGGDIFKMFVYSLMMFLFLIPTVPHTNYFIQKLETDILIKHLGEEVFIFALFKNIKKKLEINNTLEVVVVNDYDKDEIDFIKKYSNVYFEKDTVEIKQIFLYSETNILSDCVIYTYPPRLKSKDKIADECYTINVNNTKRVIKNTIKKYFDDEL